MNDEERFLFDLMGYIVVEDVLSPEHVAELNTRLDEYDLWQDEAQYPVPVGAVYRTERKAHIGDTYKWDEAFRRVINHPRVMPYLEALVGPTCRFDDDYVILMKPGGEVLGLHGGGEDPYQDIDYYRYRNGRMHNGLIVVSFALGDVRPGDGGFAAVPGSHKSNYPLPERLRDMTVRGPWLRHVPQKAGSAIIFTEALTHGTMPWTAGHERRSLLCKYCPGTMAWIRDYPRTAAVPEAEWPDEVRRMMQPPYRQGREPVFAPMAAPPVP